MARQPSNTPQKKAPQELTETHRSMAIFAAQGLSQKEIAEEFNYHPGTISAIFSSPLFKVLVAEYREKLTQQVRAKVRKLAEPAIDRLESIVRQGDDGAANTAITTVLKYTIPTADAEAKVEAAKEVAKADVQKIILGAELLAQMRQGYIEHEPEDILDVTPRPAKPIKELLAELKAAEEVALEHP